MTQSQIRTNLGAPLSALAVGLWLGAALSPGLAAAETSSEKQQLLELTGGRRVKAVWNQDQKVKFFDTKDGVTRDLPLGNQANACAPLISADGTKVFNSNGKAPADRVVMMYDTETNKVTELAKGPGNNLLTVWTDPKTRKIWLYVNDSGDKGEGWNVPAGKIHRFSVDKPAERELFWERTSSHIYLMFSADGTRACFEPGWGNIGQLKLAFDGKGNVDQDKSEYKSFGGGCFPSMAPDNSYRVFRLEGDHKEISVCDADGANPRKVDVTGALTAEQKAKGRNTWLTRWSTDPRFITLVAPAGDDAQIHMGRLDEGATKFEAWARVSAEKGPQCWQSHAWIEQKR